MKELLLALMMLLAAPTAHAGDAPIPDCPPTAPKPADPSAGQAMQATAYDDGNSCPEECKKSHVVFAKRHNGTANAYHPKKSQPEANPPKYEPCEEKHECKICFKENSDCLLVKYMGQGPPVGKFDFPVVFYKANCHRQDLPPQLKNFCAYINKHVARYDGRINCFKNPLDKNCEYLMQRRAAEQEADTSAYRACKSSGLAAYNSTAPDGKKRSHDCDYSEKKSQFKSKANGQVCYRYWFMLLPGVCPKGSYVGKYGNNCCRGDPFWAGALGADCEEYFPKPEF